ncbi:MAG: hypothetical protein JSS83_09235 [Cyanobacteria bacterium SZAS LIN-3]|nr:hypothetical protein [Cyanobacteria bacterium SZAS LIN-3]
MPLRTITSLKSFRLTVIAMVSLVLAIASYAAYWYAWYRISALPPKIVDLRKPPYHGTRYLTFCAGLAGNPHGFPGHAYVVWSKTNKEDPLQADSIGFIPKKYNDQFISPLVTVPGMLHYHAALYNQRNLESLTVIVDPETFDKTIAERNKWEDTDFHALTRDCLSFTTHIARTAGLKVPTNRCMYPQDQIRALKSLN